MMPALEPRDRPAAMEYTAPVPGVATTTRVVSKKTMLIGQTSTFGRCSRTRYSPSSARWLSGTRPYRKPSNQRNIRQRDATGLVPQADRLAGRRLRLRPRRVWRALRYRRLATDSPPLRRSLPHGSS